MSGSGPTLHTARLLLRRWRDQDRAPFAALNADPVVMEYFPALLAREQSDAMVDRMEAAFEENGFGLWAAEVRDTGTLAGFVGLMPVPFDAPFAPAVEVGWRLAADHWGHGYATEGAAAALDFAFDVLGLPEVVSFTSVVNERSQRVMCRLGMHRDPAEDFDRPSLPEGHPLRRHVLYRVRADEWRRCRPRPPERP